EHVDEAGGDGEAGDVDRLARGGRGEVADRGNAVATDADVGDARLAAAAVVDGAAAEDQVERRRGGGRLRRGRGRLRGARAGAGEDEQDGGEQGSGETGPTSAHSRSSEMERRE